MIMQGGHKGRLERYIYMIAGGHTIETPQTLMYFEVIFSDSVGITLIIAALNDLYNLSCDIHNVYLTTNCCENIWMVPENELGSYSGNNKLIVWALYGLKTSGAKLKSFLVETLLPRLHAISIRL